MEASGAGRGGEELAWLSLRLIPGVGSVRYARLLSAFGSPQDALAASRPALEATGVGPAVAEAVAANRFSREPAEEMDHLASIGGRVVHLNHPDYPPLLRQVHAPPPVLFVLGDLAPARAGGVALVGSRDFSAYGRRVAHELGRDLALAGVSVISGLARGIDTVAHTAALEAGGHTVGVLGCGLNVAYPPENRKLARRMAQEGAVVSEFPLNTRPSAGNFPVRNRVISGLSRAVVVVEAGQRSGALITARHALDQGREVGAVPGPVGSQTSHGCFELLRQGAQLVASARDLLDDGGLAPSLVPAPAGAQTGPEDLPPDWARLLELVGPEPVHVDLLTRESGLMPQEVNAIMVSLEMEGLVEQRPGKHYVRL